MTFFVPIICNACKHLKVENNEYVCPAFPDKIPLTPHQAPYLHDRVLEGQVGDTVFEFDEEARDADFIREMYVVGVLKRNQGDPGMSEDIDYEEMVGWQELKSQLNK